MYGAAVTRRLSITLAVVASCLIGVIPASGQGSIRSRRGLDQFLTYYYTDPHPELVQSAIEYVAASGILVDDAAQAPTVAFFGEILARDKARIADWTAVIQRQPEPARSVLSRAVALSADPARFIAADAPTPSRNDACWGAFFATGNTSYVDLLIRQLVHMDERDDLTLFLTAASAKWSLASNLHTHSRVDAAVRAAQKTAQGPLASDLADILQKSPEAIQQEFVDVLRQRWRKTP
jgi:hypothetical protein